MSFQPSEAELEILQVLWAIEPASVRSIHERILESGKDVGYTTVLKQIQRLTEKGALDKDVVDGVHLYRSLVNEKDVKQELAGKVMRTAFGGSALQMMMHALGQEKPDAAELEELKKWLDQQMKK
ncbi:MAG TPA: transcriptional regulator [Saprospirales bacterium]|nr:transcriptional regulator [Saprospirales bacterium]HLP94377.1 BlaI/MecI/CopY family transcriptional regulator [Saprospiraceae bacterium]